MKSLFDRGGLLAVGLGVLLTSGGQAQTNENETFWNQAYLSVGGGLLDFERDEAVESAGLIAIRLGYELSESWSTEIGLDLLPRLPQSMRTEWDTGQHISRLKEQAGVDETSAIRLGVEALWHIARRSTLDPYLVLGAGGIWYDDTFDQEFEGFGQTGAGCFYHFNENWALRADARAILAGNDTEFNSTYTLGLVFWPASRSVETRADTRPGTTMAPATPLVQDADNDGLTDAEEKQYATDPMRADSDWDALSDGDEIHKHKTDPLKRDTDGGGVYDGHEVIEDKTGPSQPADDLQFFELRLMFDPNDSTIKSEYFSEIGVIGKILRDDPGATARIEGHLDSHSYPSVRRAQTLSERRAQAIQDALVADWKITRNRLTTAGYGATRPKGPSQPEKGTAENERIEIYIRRTTAWR
jgi:outer membrane protein OmpA-like peptidoglycan-associated protein